MSVLSDKLNDVFMNIHNKFVDLNRNKADKSDTYTKEEVDNKIANSGGSITVDQTYDAESENAQSGAALSPVINGKVDKRNGYGLIKIAYTEAMLDYYVIETLEGDVYSEQYFYNTSQMDSKLDKKANKTTIIYITEPIFSFEFATLDNVEIRGEVLTSLSFTFGDDEYRDGYTSGISFDSGEIPTAIDYTDSGILNWVGTDCVTSNGLSIFQPSPNTHYDIVFYFNGVQFIGLVNGFVPATGNVVSE